MLNFDIKRKINTLRDILVGKVPDPKAQVEQITIALIYKFMDDMDLEGMEFGGSREFFKEEYEKYAWVSIMQPENSGQQRANLYTEGIDKMSMNPHLPQLFRDIFRGAYVPYRDPETLNMFLKEISDFKYDHSEELGNAFEYLLSIMGSQGDAGQFRTPRHIIDMMVEIIDPRKTDSILDPACGTAGFLISSYKHILEKNKDKEGHSTLSADERKRMTENFAGYDISPDMVRLSRVNMYLHKFAKPQISEYDTLSSLEKWDDSYDIILANPPFMTPKGGIIPHNRYRIQAKRAEVLFVDYIAEHLNPTGKAGVIVPEGIVFQSSKAYKALREYLVEDDLLYAVISLPAGVFNPYSGVKTSILLMDKTLAKQKDEILFIKIDNDGYNLGAQRREVKGSDIPEVIKIIKDYQNGIDVSDNSIVTIATKQDIAEQDYILVGERYKEVVVSNTDYPIVELGEICEVLAGNPAPQDKELFINGKYPFFRTADVGNVHLSDNLVDAKDYLNEDGVNGLKLFRRGTILLPKSGASTFLNHRAILGVDGYVSSHLACLVCDESKVNNKYLYRILINIDAKSLTADQGYPSLNIKQISSIRVPLPPLHIQEEIVKEIEGYQKVIDGAKQVVENYKPTIKVDPSWEMVKLGDVCEIISGQSPDSKYYNTNEEGLPFYQGKTEFTDKYLGKPVKWTTDVTKESLPNDILMSVRAPVGPVNINKDRICIGRGLAAIRCKNGILVDYLFVYLLGIQKDITGNGGAVFDSISRIGISSINIPLPALETQNEIVRKINEEMTIIDQNKRLIEIFEQKIKDKISEVWGD
jgi:type I restriction enzyme M protein